MVFDCSKIAITRLAGSCPYWSQRTPDCQTDKFHYETSYLKRDKNKVSCITVSRKQIRPGSQQHVMSQQFFHNENIEIDLLIGFFFPCFPFSGPSRRPECIQELDENDDRAENYSQQTGMYLQRG